MRVTRQHDHEVNLQQAIAVVWRRWWIIAVIVVVTAGGALLHSWAQESRYEASTLVRVTSPSASRLFSNPQVNALNPARLVETETLVVLANDVRSAVDARLGEHAPDIGDVSVTNPSGTDALKIAVTSTSPAVARDAADAFAEVYVAKRRNESVTDLAQRYQELRAQADEIGRQVDALHPGDPRRVALQSSQNSFLALANQYEAEAGLLKTDAQIVDPARLPAEPVSPRPLRDAAVGVILALVLAVGVVFLIDHLDDRVTGPDDLERGLPGVPLLGSIPIYDRRRRRRGRTRMPRGRRTLIPLDSVESEAYRTLRSNVRFSKLGVSRRVLIVTSAAVAEGKSTVACNLAVSLAETGQQVLVVSGDLRRPSLSDFFGIEETGAGLTTTLTGERPLADTIVPVEVGGNHLRVLPAGPLPPNPATVLGSRALDRLVHGLEGTDAEVVLVDSPPVLPVADALAFAQIADGVILVCVVGQTRVRHLVEARERIQRVGVDVVGLVLNGVPTARGRYPYYYHHRYYRERGAGRLPGNGHGAATPAGRAAPAG